MYNKPNNLEYFLNQAKSEGIEFKSEELELPYRDILKLIWTKAQNNLQSEIVLELKETFGE